MVALGGCMVAAAAVSEQAESPPAIEFSVLTPAMEGRFVVATGFDFTMLVPPYLELSKLAGGAKSGRLRALVARHKYRPERTIAERLVDALNAASYQAVHEPIARKPAGSIQSLAWSDLPERPQGRLMLDVTIRWICLCSEVAFTKLYPGIALSWRLLDARRSVVQPTRTMTYLHSPLSMQTKKPRSAPDRNPVAVREYPPEKISESCGFSSVAAAEESPEVLWGCFGEAYDAALRRLVIDLTAAQAPRPADPAPAPPVTG
jgi:hypothetical protein